MTRKRYGVYTATDKGTRHCFVLPGLYCVFKRGGTYIFFAFLYKRLAFYRYSNGIMNLWAEGRKDRLKEEVAGKKEGF